MKPLDEERWPNEWALDAEPLATAQAIHVPSGLRLAIYNVPHASGEPCWVATRTEHSKDLVQRLVAQMGQLDGNAWVQARGEEALQLWREMGYDAPEGHRPAHVTPRCKLLNWRSNWNVDDNTDQGLGLPDAVHNSGLAFRLQYMEVDPDGWTGWQPIDAQGAGDRNRELSEQLGSAAVAAIERELCILWMEEGYFDNPFKIEPKPFSDDWREHWHGVPGQAGEIWMEHASGMRFKPAIQAIDEQGNTARVLLTHPDYRVRESLFVRAVGEKCWGRIRNQAWQLCEEQNLLGEHPSLL